ncbi:unnamed protein product, partial [Prorocentrum cordatum]
MASSSMPGAVGEIAYVMHAASVFATDADGVFITVFIWVLFSCILVDTFCGDCGVWYAEAFNLAQSFSGQVVFYCGYFGLVHGVAFTWELSFCIQMRFAMLGDIFNGYCFTRYMVAFTWEPRFFFLPSDSWCPSCGVLHGADSQLVYW